MGRKNTVFFYFYLNKYTYPHTHTKKTEGVILQWEELASKKEERWGYSWEKKSKVKYMCKDIIKAIILYDKQKTNLHALNEQNK